MARLVEQTCQRVYQYEPWYQLDTPSCSYKATCRGLTLCMSEKASSSPSQVTEAAPKDKSRCLVEQTSQGEANPQRQPNPTSNTKSKNSRANVQ